MSFRNFLNRVLVLNRVSGTQIFSCSPIPKYTVRHETFTGFNFCDFSSDPQKKVPTKYVFLLQVLDKNESFSMLGTGYFLKLAKINSQQEKPICPNRKN